MKIIECPRDAMQGIEEFIPTEKKARYINSLLKVGFDTIDFGSFVSPKAIPQLRDTAELLSMLDLSVTKSKLLAIVANVRGAQDACSFDEIAYLGYPFSISETFQRRNTNASIDQSLERVEEMQDMCLHANKSLVVYISMAFGNPYGDPWSPDLAVRWTEKLVRDLGIRTIALSDTVGVSNTENIESLFTALIPSFPEVEFGAHLHSRPEETIAKVKSAYASGCRRFDAAIKGLGGCPMAEDQLVGNVDTELLLLALPDAETKSIDTRKLKESVELSSLTFPI